MSRDIFNTEFAEHAETEIERERECVMDGGILLFGAPHLHAGLRTVQTYESDISFCPSLCAL
jgi:hypothetical protein